MNKPTFPRMLLCLVLTVVLIAAALLLQAFAPGTLLAVTAYKAHLMALGGWGGYWLDRALFPYARPDIYITPPEYFSTQADMEYRDIFASAMKRRAIVVAACLICVGLGA